MSLTVIETFVPDKFPLGYHPSEGMWIAYDKFGFHSRCKIDGVVGKLHFFGLEGLRYNGASNPIDWPIKSYYDDAKKDCCGLGHDLLYAHGGEVRGLGRKLTAGECDDFIRGAMREAGFNRKEAGVVDWAVRHFAHWFHFGPKHDKEEMHCYSEIVWVPEVQK